MCDYTLKFSHILLSQENIFSFESKWGHFIWHVVPKNVKVSVKAILTTRISKYWKLKNSSKRLYMRPNAFNRQFLIIPVKNYQKVMLSNQYTTKKSNFKVDILETMKQMHFFENSSFWVQHVISNVLTHFQMKIYFPVIIKCEKILVCNHTYLCILNFTFVS